MASEPALEYLARTLRRLADRGFEESEQAHDLVVAKAGQQGRHQSGGTVVQVRTAREEILEAVKSKMARAALEAMGSNEEAARVLKDELRGFRERRQTSLVRFYSLNSGWIGRLAAEQDEFVTRTDAIIEAAIDDYQHGMHGGARFSKDAIVNVTTVNSPGAVVQAGQGNVQRDISIRSSEIRSAISAFLNSSEVQTLKPVERQSLIDVTDVIESELVKTMPDTGKLGRWGQRLAGIAEKLGVSVAAGAILRLLFG